MVTADPDEARAAVDRGEKVVLIVAPPAGAPGDDRLGDAHPDGGRPGRLAVFVGDAADPAAWEAAAAMEGELFM